jgi:hypothetical protein
MASKAYAQYSWRGMVKKSRVNRQNLPKAVKRPSRKEQYTKLVSENKDVFERNNSILTVGINVLKYHARYETASTVFGHPMGISELVERIKMCNWRASMIEISYWAALIGNGDGLRDGKVQNLANEAIVSLTASAERDQAKLQRARDFVKFSPEKPVLVNEQAIIAVQHLIILHGSDESLEAPLDGEIVLWILAASDYTGKWEKDEPTISIEDQLIADVAMSARFNRSEDAIASLLRASKLFSIAPAHGKLSNEIWHKVQAQAFGKNFSKYFDEFLMPLYLLSYSWGREPRAENYPLLHSSRLAAFALKAPEFANHLKDFVSTRDELVTEIRKRMRPDESFPHAPTALLYKPFVDLGEAGILASSPQNVRNVLKTGVWNKYRVAVSEMGNKYKNEWTVNFGNIFEEYIRSCARRVQAMNVPSKILIPTHPGAEDEIEDVVVVEGNSIVMFSVKSLMMRENVARHAISRRDVVDWYEKYFFELQTSKEGESFRGGALRQLNKRIDMIREGKFESLGVTRDVKIHPVVVTYDNLCENHIIYEWIERKCKEYGILGQDVAKPAFVSVDIFEQLMGLHAQGRSVISLLKRRDKERDTERVDVMISDFGGVSEESLRLPGWKEDYQDLAQRMAPAIGVPVEEIMAAFSK